MNFRMFRKRPHIAAVAVAAAIVILPSLSARAERADKDKPTHIEANRMNSDDARRVTIFEGNVILTKGTILLRADRIMVRQDAEGFQITTATGGPARFRQKRDAHDEWIEGEALRIELDDRNGKIELHQRARLTRDQDEVRGELISVDTRSEFFSVSGAKGPAAGAGPEARVRAVIQPKTQDLEAGKSAPAAKR
jgi:lipopolysaccharide export system protein LptA